MQIKMEDEKIEQEFDKIIDDMTINQFWKFVRSWFSVETILDIMKEWEIGTKRDAIDEMKEIMAEKEDMCISCGITDKTSLIQICDECAVDKGIKDKY